MLIENPVNSYTKGLGVSAGCRLSFCRNVLLVTKRLNVNVTTQNFIRTYRNLGRVSDEVISPEVTKGRVVLGKCVYESVTLVLTLVAGSDVV